MYFFCHCFLLATAAVEFFKLWLITHTHSRRQTETHSTRTHTQYGDNKQTDTRKIFHFFLQIPLEKVKKKGKVVKCSKKDKKSPSVRKIKRQRHTVDNFSSFLCSVKFLFFLF